MRLLARGQYAVDLFAAVVVAAPFVAVVQCCVVLLLGVVVGAVLVGAVAAVMLVLLPIVRCMAVVLLSAILTLLVMPGVVVYVPSPPAIRVMTLLAAAVETAAPVVAAVCLVAFLFTACAKLVVDVVMSCCRSHSSGLVSGKCCRIASGRWG